MPSRYKVKRGDSSLYSKHADESFVFEDGFMLIFYNTPKKGKATTVDYTKSNYPAVSVHITANWKAKLEADAAKKDPFVHEERF